MGSVADVILRSFEIAAERCGDLTPLVYAKLFREQPEIERLFHRDISGALKGDMLGTVIESILDFVGDRHFSYVLIQSEVMSHEGHQVTPDVFLTFFPTLADCVRDACGDAWTSDMEAAWREVLAALKACVEQSIEPAAASPDRLASAAAR
ncbi:MAG: globin [Alphaproteobacteria bacterium]|nr:globin [Alphaproteobacteria bacterium]